MTRVPFFSGFAAGRGSPVYIYIYICILIYIYICIYIYIYYIRSCVGEISLSGNTRIFQVCIIQSVGRNKTLFTAAVLFHGRGIVAVWSGKSPFRLHGFVPEKHKSEKVPGDPKSVFCQLFTKRHDRYTLWKIEGCVSLISWCCSL